MAVAARLGCYGSVFMVEIEDEGNEKGKYSEIDEGMKLIPYSTHGFEFVMKWRIILWKVCL